MFKHYVFWLGIVSVFCLILERIVPWRKEQKLLRPEFSQDLFWLIFNGYFASLIFLYAFHFLYYTLDSGFSFFFQKNTNSIHFISEVSFLSQMILFLIIADFLEWITHNALHRVGWLWKIHRVHHSIQIMDWIGNFRFHWGELFVYQTIKYLPLAVLGVRWDVILACSVVSTFIGHLNHSNLNISWGPLRYVVNSPRMHIWHHEKEIRGKAGVNFAVVFSLWDWVFGTAYMPKDALQPAQIGYKGDEHVSHNMIMRFFLPFIDKKIGPVKRV